MTVVKVVATHLALYLVTYLSLDLVEDNLTSSGTVALVILGASVPLSFLANLWALTGPAPRSAGNALRAILITALISPMSLMGWLALYVKLAGYES